MENKSSFSNCNSFFPKIFLCKNGDSVFEIILKIICIFMYIPMMFMVKYIQGHNEEINACIHTYLREWVQMKKTICSLLLFLVFISFTVNSTQASEVIRINNTVRNDGKIEKTIQISSGNLDYLSSENPLIPSDPVWKMSETKKNGNMFVLEGTAVVDSGTKCLSFEDVNLEMEKDGVFNLYSYRAVLSFNGKASSSGKYQTMAYMINPIAREIAKNSDADPEQVAKAVNIAGFAIDKVDEMYKTIKLADLIGGTEIHYKVNLPEPGLFVTKKDLEPEVSAIISGRELLRNGKTVVASTKFLPPMLAHTLTLLIIFAVLVISGAFFISSKRKKNLSDLESNEGDQTGNFRF